MRALVCESATRLVQPPLPVGRVESRDVADPPAILGHVRPDDAQLRCVLGCRSQAARVRSQNRAGGQRSRRKAAAAGAGDEAGTHLQQPGREPAARPPLAQLCGEEDLAEKRWL